MDISTLTKRGNKEYRAAAKVFFKLLFHLDKEPVVLSQCCNDDPTTPPNDDGRESCTGGLITTAQKHLDSGTPVVIELFGRRTVDGGQGFLYDTVTVYVPGQKIDREFFQKMIGQETFEVTNPYTL